jgi:DedD protein
MKAERLVIQVGAFRERSRAEVVKEQLRKKGYPAHVGSAAGERGGLFNVYVGPYSTREQADRVKTRLVEQERFKPFIVRQ